MGGRYVYLIFYGTPIFFGGVCARYDSGIHFRNPLYLLDLKFSEFSIYIGSMFNMCETMKFWCRLCGSPVTFGMVL